MSLTFALIVNVLLNSIKLPRQSPGKVAEIKPRKKNTSIFMYLKYFEDFLNIQGHM